MAATELRSPSSSTRRTSTRPSSSRRRSRMVEEAPRGVTATSTRSRDEEAGSRDHRRLSRPAEPGLERADLPLLPDARRRSRTSTAPSATPSASTFSSTRRSRTTASRIELRDVTAQQALERVMQAANHFYKVLDEKTIIVVPDNPQTRRDYEDLVIQTFYLSNGDAEQVTNVVRTMIEARNVFPLKALNAITIRDTADKVRIAEKIIEANDKAKAEVVVRRSSCVADSTRRSFATSARSSGLSRHAQRRAPRTGRRSSYRWPDHARRSRASRTLTGDLMFTMPTVDVCARQERRATRSCSLNRSCESPRARRRRCTSASSIPIPVSTFTARTGTSDRTRAR